MKNGKRKLKKDKMSLNPTIDEFLKNTNSLGITNENILIDTKVKIQKLLDYSKDPIRLKSCKMYLDLIQDNLSMVQERLTSDLYYQLVELFILYDIGILVEKNSKITVYMNIKLGGGKQTSVYLAKWDSRQISIKFTHPFSQNSFRTNWHENEILFLKKIRHKHLLVYLSDAKLTYSTALITNLFPYNNLDILNLSIRSGDMLRSNGYKNQCLTEEVSRLTKISPLFVIFYTKMILETETFLLGRRTIHRDIKPSNVFIDSGYLIGLGDFELAIQYLLIDQPIELKNQGTYQYCLSDFYLKQTERDYAKYLDFLQIAMTVFHLSVNMEFYKKLVFLQSKCALTIHNSKDCKSLESLTREQIQLKELVEKGFFYSKNIRLLTNHRDNPNYEEVAKLLENEPIENKIKFGVNRPVDGYISKQKFDVTSANFISELLEVDISKRRINQVFIDLLNEKASSRHLKHLYLTNYIQDVNVKPYISISDKRMNRKFLVELQKEQLWDYN